MSVVLALALLSATAHVKVTASFLPARGGDGAAIAVHLMPVAPHVSVNEDPPPRLKLEKDQEVLIDKQVPPRKPAAPYDPGRARYLDPALPVAFPVALSPRAPKGLHTVEATVTYFYCSKSEGWCRKGTAEIEVPVRVP